MRAIVNAIVNAVDNDSQLRMLALCLFVSAMALPTLLSVARWKPVLRLSLTSKIVWAWLVSVAPVSTWLAPSSTNFPNPTPGTFTTLAPTNLWPL